MMVLALSRACGRGIEELDWALSHRPHAFDALWESSMSVAAPEGSARAVGEAYADVRARIAAGRRRNLERAERGRP